MMVIGGDFTIDQGTPMTELIPPTPTPAELAATVAEADAHHTQARAPATLRAYRADWRAFEAWCTPLQGIRDRAILLVGFAGAFRRSELAGMTLDDIQFTNDGLVITLRHSKTDQEGEGYDKGIPYGSTPATCPVRALRAWLEASGI